MAVATDLWTYEKLCEIPDDGMRREIIDGRLYVNAAPDERHQAVLSEANDLLKGWVRPRKLGRVYFSPVDVHFSSCSTVQPDLVFIARDRRHIYASGSAKVEGAPDLVVEVLSPRTRQYDLTEKLALYQVNGVPEYWHVDPYAEVVTVLTLEDGACRAVEPDDMGRLASAILPGLIVDPKVLFAPLR